MLLVLITSASYFVNFNRIVYCITFKNDLFEISMLIRFKKGSCQFLEKECTQYWLTA